jgi:hypothetical protein
MMSENIDRNMLSSQGILNYPTQLQLVGHFRILYHNTREHNYQEYRVSVSSGIHESYCTPLIWFQYLC